MYCHEMKGNRGDGSQRYQSTEQNPTTHTTLFFLWQRGREGSCGNSGDLEMIIRGIDEIAIEL